MGNGMDIQDAGQEYLAIPDNIPVKALAGIALDDAEECAILTLWDTEGLWDEKAQFAVILPDRLIGLSGEQIEEEYDILWRLFARPVGIAIREALLTKARVKAMGPLEIGGIGIILEVDAAAEKEWSHRVETMLKLENGLKDEEEKS